MSVACQWWWWWCVVRRWLRSEPLPVCVALWQWRLCTRGVVVQVHTSFTCHVIAAETVLGCFRHVERQLSVVIVWRCRRYLCASVGHFSWPELVWRWGGGETCSCMYRLFCWRLGTGRVGTVTCVVACVGCATVACVCLQHPPTASVGPTGGGLSLGLHCDPA